MIFFSLFSINIILFNYRKKDSPNTGIVLDEFPHRFFRENMPMSMPMPMPIPSNVRIDFKREYNIRNNRVSAMR